MMVEQWTIKTIGELCSLVNGGTPKSKISEYWGGEVNWITPSEMGKLTTPYIGTTQRKITELGLQKSSAKLFPPNSVILSTRAPIGHLAINTSPMSTNQGCKTLVPNEELDPKFLYYFLWFNKELLDSLGTGATFKELSGKNLKGVEIPVPPLDEQRRIVSILDEAFENIHSSTEITELELSNTSGMLNSVLDHLFGGIIHYATMKSLDELTEEDSPITYGVVKPGSEGTIPFVRGGDVSNGRVHTSSLRTITESVSNQYSRTVLRGREILVSLVGQPGQIGIVPPSLAGANIARQVGRIRLREGINEEFVMMYLRSESAQQSLRSIQGGSVQQVINLRDLRKILVPVVDIEEQLRIANIAQNMASEIELLVDALSDKIFQFSELKQSILQEAFSGKLTGGIAA